MNKFVIVLSILVSSCLPHYVERVDMKNRLSLFDGQIKGHYSVLAWCVVDKLQTTNTMDSYSRYNVRLYPDIEKSEVYAYSTPTSYALLLELKQVDKSIVHAILKGGNFYHPPIALEVLQSCSP